MISLPFSENAAEIFQLTEKNALERNNPYIFPEHMIEVLLDKDKEITHPILNECNIDIDSFHKNSPDGILNFWKQQGAQLSVDDLTALNPYLGRVTEPGGGFS